ncbi:MAG: hypothetical protein ABIV47_10195 [Roseiflexaceae bacterium]
MPSESPFPLHQVHLDFHTSPGIPDVGADWDATHWLETLTRARQFDCDLRRPIMQFQGA